MFAIIFKITLFSIEKKGDEFFITINYYKTLNELKDKKKLHDILLFVLLKSKHSVQILFGDFFLLPCLRTEF